MRDVAPPPNVAEAIAYAIGTRRAVRAFRPDPVPRHSVEELLALAARAPSGTNMQPWRCHVVAGPVRDALCAGLIEAHAAQAAGLAEHHSEYAYYPEEFFEPYLSRRRKVGWDLYRLLGIARGEKERMQAQHARNLDFFGAPVGLIVTIDRRLKIGSWLDCGMFLQNLMIAARGQGLDTCPQAAFAPFHAVIRKHVPLAGEEIVVCAMALGYADPEAPENRLATERAPIEEFVTFHGL